MNTRDFFNGFVDPACHKIEHNTAEVARVRSLPGLLKIKATTFYQIYKHNVFGSDERFTIQDFYRVAGQYLYYDKMVCTHGTEFYYYVSFNEANAMYKVTKDLIRHRVDVNSPERLTDLLHIVPAAGRE